MTHARGEDFLDARGEIISVCRNCLHGHIVALCGGTSAWLRKRHRYMRFCVRADSRSAATFIVMLPTDQ
jgi:hypothetical protein